MKVGNHVTSARTLSLAIIALGYLGWQLGMFHNDRADLFARVVDIVTVGWIDQQIRAGKRPFDTWNRSSPIEVRGTPFGVLRIGNPASGINTDQPAESRPMRVSVDGTAGKFKIRATRFANDDIDRRAEAWSALVRELEGKIAKLKVEPDPKTVTDARQALYQRQLAVPGIDVVTFNSEIATWIASILCFLILVVVRNRVNGIFRDANVGNDEPWLILDARLPVEKAVSAAWLAGIALSGWLVNFGPILASIDLERAGELNSLSLVFAIVAVLLLMSVSGWLSLKIVSDLLCIRKIRKKLDLDNRESS